MLMPRHVLGAVAGAALLAGCAGGAQTTQQASSASQSEEQAQSDGQQAESAQQGSSAEQSEGEQAQAESEGAGDSADGEQTADTQSGEGSGSDQAADSGQSQGSEGSTDTASAESGEGSASGDEAAQMGGDPTAFTKALAQAYREYAKIERDLGTQDVAFFEKRAEKAANGVQVEPVSVATADSIPNPPREDMRGARSRLLKLVSDGVHKDHPGLVAAAQAGYDCWVRKWLKKRPDGARRVCRDDMKAAFTKLDNQMMAAAPTVQTTQVEAPEKEGPDPLASTVYLYFPFDVAEPKDASLSEANRVKKLFAQNDGTDLTVHLTGHADRAGPKPYNMDLSKRRAKNVRDILVGKGVPADALKLDWKGETDPLVPTEDGVRHPRNRRVEIEFQKGEMEGGSGDNMDGEN